MRNLFSQKTTEFRAKIYGILKAKLCENLLPMETLVMIT